MLSKMLGLLYPKVFINIIIKRESCSFHVEVYSNNKQSTYYDKEFDTIIFNEQMFEYVQEFIKDSPYYYVAILDNSSDQGALPSCTKSILNSFEDLSTSEYKCIENKWSCYTSKTDLYALEKSYEDIGVDFVFSPFIVLANFFKDKREKNLAMYALLQDNGVCVMIFNEGELLFAQYLQSLINTEENITLDEYIDPIEDTLELNDDGIDLDDLHPDENLSDIDELSNIEDLDSLEDIEEFSEGKDLEEELLENQTEEISSDKEHDTDSNFNEEYQKFTLIQKALDHYYKDERYDSKFIETIYIADATHATNDLKRYIEEEMFLNVYVRSIDLPSELGTLVKKELGI